MFTCFDDHASSYQQMYHDKNYNLNHVFLTTSFILAIISQQIDGEAFLLLTQTDIVKIMSIKLGPALKIYNAILILKSSSEEG